MIYDLRISVLLKTLKKIVTTIISIFIFYFFILKT